MLTLPNTVEQVEERHIQRARVNDAWHVKVMELALGDAMTAWDTPTDELIQGSETQAVEFKQTARWNVREQKKDKLMEDIVAKTVAGFANALGGTLLIGVHDKNYPVGLEPDLALFTPPTNDQFVNWLDTMLEHRVGFALAHRIQLTINAVRDYDVCRVDVPAATKPIHVTYKGDKKLFVRRNNSTRAVKEADIDGFIQTRFDQQA